MTDKDTQYFEEITGMLEVFRGPLEAMGFEMKLTTNRHNPGGTPYSVKMEVRHPCTYDGEYVNYFTKKEEVEKLTLPIIFEEWLVDYRYEVEDNTRGYY